MHPDDVPVGVVHEVRKDVVQKLFAQGAFEALGETAQVQ